MPKRVQNKPWRSEKDRMNCFEVPQNNTNKPRREPFFRPAGGGRADRRPPVEDTALIFTSCRHRQSIKAIWEYQVEATAPLPIEFTISSESQKQGGSRNGSGAVVHATQREKKTELVPVVFQTASSNLHRRREGVKGKVVVLVVCSAPSALFQPTQRATTVADTSSLFWVHMLLLPLRMPLNVVLVLATSP